MDGDTILTFRMYFHHISIHNAENSKIKIISPTFIVRFLPKIQNYLKAKGKNTNYSKSAEGF